MDRRPNRGTRSPGVGPGRDCAVPCCSPGVHPVCRRRRHRTTRAAPVLATLIADDWLGVTPYGSFTKRQSLDDLGSGAWKITAIADPGGMKVRVFSGVAVVTGGHEEKGIYKGKEYAGRFAWTDVWVKRTGRWQVVASQSTLLAPG